MPIPNMDLPENKEIELFTHSEDMDLLKLLSGKENVMSAALSLALSFADQFPKDVKDIYNANPGSVIKVTISLSRMRDK